MATMTPASNQPRIIRLTDQELATQTVESHNLQAALTALQEDGLVVLENAVNPAHLDKLNARMVADAAKLKARKTTHVNFSVETNNIQQEPCPEEGFVFDDVIANPWAAAILDCMVGSNPKVRLYSANTAFKAEARQPVHIDVPHGFPSVPHGFCININLVSTSPQNGATEFWLGTHNDPQLNMLTINGEGGDGPDPVVASQKRAERAKALGVPVDFADELIEKRRAIRPPIQPGMPKGSLIIRDIRLWHAGMPNHTDDPRVMLVTVVFSHWYRSNQQLILPNRWQGRIDWGKFDPCVKWVENDHDYLQGFHDINFELLP
ncbi:hypothetical protein F5884DRAFT_798377 [Xylogone sp. PMI_703]|nr:hypothetical protein F5884DRAFT_798377 [Xylogone sp. PMI_703]